MKLFFIGLMLTGLAVAKNDLSHRPLSFSTSKGKAVFVDFLTAEYDIVYDAANESARALAIIEFAMPEEGNPIFDSVEAPLTIMLDGSPVTADEVSTPSGETTLRVINKKMAIGTYKMMISVPLKSLVEFKKGEVRSAFWTSDLTERKFLERYLPANLEYDQVKMSFKISFLGSKTRQKIYTNGKLIETKQNSFRIEFPEYFNASSIYFHTVPDNGTDELRFSLKSLDGREIPSVVYFGKATFGNMTSLSKLKDMATQIFHELEGDYGAWPHPSLTIYNAGSGGMEYHGATMTSTSALGHEMFHSYFARGMMPANGNSGWLDEALASWRDEQYPSTGSLSGTSRMSAHPYYTRTTDMAAYNFGQRFMSYLDGKLKNKGGLKPFMRHMIENRKFAPLFVEEFIKEMGEFYGISVEADFKKYTYGSSNNFFVPMKSNHTREIHHKMTLEELKKFL